METLDAKNIIIRDILNMVGLDIKQGKIYDIDKMAYLIYNDGFLFIDDQSQLIHRKDNIFDPIGNVKLIKYIFEVFLNKEREDNGVYVLTLASAPYPDRVPNKPTKYRLETVTTRGAEYFSDYYFLESLQYIQSIYVMSGAPIPIDLHLLDYTRDQMEEMYNSKRK